MRNGTAGPAAPSTGRRILRRRPSAGKRYRITSLDSFQEKLLKFSDFNYISSQVVGLIALHDEGIQLLAGQPKFLLVLQDLFGEKTEDDEIILQLLHTFQCLISSDECRDALLGDQEANLLTSYVMDLMRDRSAIILREASSLLEMIANLQKSSSGVNGQDWSERIRGLKFEVYNQNWIAEIKRSEEHSSFGDADLADQYGSVDALDTMGWDHGSGGVQWDVAEGLAERDWMNMDEMG